jgi:hypothetical protein
VDLYSLFLLSQKKKKREWSSCGCAPRFLKIAKGKKRMSEEIKIEKRSGADLQHVDQSTPMGMIAIAMAQGANSEQLERLWELNIRYQKNEAMKAYNEALAEFKREPLTLKKNATASFPTKSGGRMSYEYLTLSSAVDVVVPLLSKHGLSHSWDIKQDGGYITVTCKLSHMMGHSESVSMSSGLDQTGQKNPIQQIGSTTAYLERYTFLAILGLSPSGTDDDGQTHMMERDPAHYITDSDVADLAALIDETKTDEKKFLSWARVERLEDIKKLHLEKCITMLQRKRGDK